MTYRDPANGQEKQDKLTASTVTGLTHAFSYMPATTSLLPLVLDEADQGRYGPLMSLAKVQWTDRCPARWTRRHAAVLIYAEDADRYRPDPADADTVMGDDLARLFFSPCAVWPKGERPAGFNQPLVSKVPAL